MNNTLETLRDALLLTLIVILMYIMYKRLLRILGKDKASRPRASLLDTTDQFENGMFAVRFNLPESAHVVLEIYRDSEDQAILKLESDLQPGDHSMEVPAETFSKSAKYAYSFKTDGCRFYRVIRVAPLA